MTNHTPQIISKSKILLVEGKDEECFFHAFLKYVGLDDSIQIIQTEGISKLSASIGSLKTRSGYRQVKSIGIMRDADKDSNSAFQAVCTALKNNDLPVPLDQLKCTEESDKPRITVLIIPYGKPTGMLENICLESVCDDEAMECVDNFFICLAKKHRTLLENNIPKARVRLFLASRELLEIAYFECLQDCIRSRNTPTQEHFENIVPRTHAFLSSRYTPDLSLGEAAGKTDREDRYWNFDHECFSSIKKFFELI